MQNAACVQRRIQNDLSGRRGWRWGGGTHQSQARWVGIVLAVRLSSAG